MLKVEALDKRGPPGSDRGQQDRVQQSSGPGTLIGVGNGDPNCQESDKEPKRSLFNGLAQVIVQSTKQPGTIQIEAARDGREGDLKPASITITTKQVELRPAVPVVSGS